MNITIGKIHPICTGSAEQEHIPTFFVKFSNPVDKKALVMQKSPIYIFTLFKYSSAQQCVLSITLCRVLTCFNIVLHKKKNLHKNSEHTHNECSNSKFLSKL